MGTNTFLPRKTGVYLPFACLFFFFSLLVKSSPPKWERSSKQRRLFDFTLGIFLRQSHRLNKPSCSDGKLFQCLFTPTPVFNRIVPTGKPWKATFKALPICYWIQAKTTHFPLRPLRAPLGFQYQQKSVLCSLWNSASPNPYLCPKLGSKLGSTPPFPTHPITNPKGIQDVHAL